MPSVKLYKQTGKEAGVLELSEAVFDVEYNEPVIHQVVVAQQNNARQGTKSTLTRAEVRGGGIKPWRQKGTGRARQGSIRSPQWNKGGVVFAPKPRDFSQKVNKSMKQLAIKSALSEKLRQEEIKVVDKLTLKNAKTKEMAEIIQNLKLDVNSILLVLDEGNEAVVRAAANIPNVTTIAADLINVYDVVAHSVCLMTEGAVKKIQEAYND